MSAGEMALMNFSKNTCKYSKLSPADTDVAEDHAFTNWLDHLSTNH